MDARLRKFLKFEKVSSLMLVVCLCSALAAVVVAVILKNLGREDSVAYGIAGVVAVASALLGFPIGFWIAGRVRHCPKCETEMQPVNDRSTLFFKCPACGFEFNTYLDNTSGS